MLKVTSASVSFRKRSFNEVRIASAGLPEAHTRNTNPFFSLYAWFNSDSSSNTV